MAENSRLALKAFDACLPDRPNRLEKQLPSPRSRSHDARFFQSRKMKHLLSIESLPVEDIRRILDLSAKMKAERGRHGEHPLRHQCWALIFSKSSTRTRLSFEVGIRELGGDAIFLSAQDIQ